MIHGRPVDRSQFYAIVIGCLNVLGILWATYCLPFQWRTK